MNYAKKFFEEYQTRSHLLSVWELGTIFSMSLCGTEGLS